MMRLEFPFQNKTKQETNHVTLPLLKNTSYPNQQRKKPQSAHVNLRLGSHLLTPLSIDDVPGTVTV